MMLYPPILLITSTSAAVESIAHGGEKKGKHHFTNREAKIPGGKIL